MKYLIVTCLLLISCTNNLSSKSSAHREKDFIDCKFSPEPFIVCINEEE